MGRADTLESDTVSAPDKTKFPRREALEVAEEIYSLLEAWCVRCKVAGSLRRRKPTVGDIEFLLIGKKLTRRKDLLENEEYNAALFRLDELVDQQVIRPRPNVKGSVSWGEKNRLAFHVETLIPIDFFIATEESWWNMLVCRTGGAINNTRLAEAYRRRGLKWHPYSPGYTDFRGNSYENHSEEDVYRNAGLRYLHPQDRP